MNIVHYSLGFPPYRTGGMTQYVTDLMQEQSALGHSVGMLWPGKMQLMQKRSRIVSTLRKDGMVSHEIINPLPVPLLEGINRPEDFMKSCQGNCFGEFFHKNHIQILHLHTLMGCYQELLQAAKDSGVRIIYTTHDYFGICPKVNLLYQGQECKTGIRNDKCSACCQNALSLNKIWVLQSVPYRFLKNAFIITLIRQFYKKRKGVERSSLPSRDDVILKNYEKLKEYYRSLFSYVTIFHYNSSIAGEIYQTHLPEHAARNISILHRGIKDNRIIKHYKKTDKLRLTFLGPADAYKGLPFLLDVLDTVYAGGNVGFSLQIFCPTNQERPYLLKKQRYSQNKIKEVFDSTDLLVVPSMWKETFGLVVPEALSFGVPVLTTDLVGAKDLIMDNECGYCLAPDKEIFVKTIESILSDREQLTKCNKNILVQKFDFNFQSHCEKLLELYQES